MSEDGLFADDGGLVDHDAALARAANARAAELVNLKATSPMRGRVDQNDVDGLGLFDLGRSPTLL